MLSWPIKNKWQNVRPKLQYTRIILVLGWNSQTDSSFSLTASNANSTYWISWTVSNNDQPKPTMWDTLQSWWDIVSHKRSSTTSGTRIQLVVERKRMYEYGYFCFGKFGEKQHFTTHGQIGIPLTQTWTKIITSNQHIFSIEIWKCNTVTLYICLEPLGTPLLTYFCPSS